MRVHRAGAVLLSALIAGCHVYAPFEAARPAPAIELALWLTDVGRLEARQTLGRDVVRVEGRVVELEDTAYVVHVLRVYDIRGVVSKWSGETVTVPRAWVDYTAARRLSVSRSYLLAGMFTAGAAAFIVTRSLGTSGGPIYQGSGGQGGGGNDQ